ncbi:MAG: UDP-3-O-(3-hydroxymyristoyl)glucosamine N-acyltransferase [Alphaproteobacteria bacterium]|nr:UDP-3-O-(3-hydroxymyristoyl)glucosamine N-acyltransferase [Alphaproteobacteria bacterium]
MSRVGARFTAAELAARLGGELVGDPEVELLGIADIRDATPEQLAFVANPRYRRHLGTTRAGAVLVDEGTEAPGQTLIRLANPYAAFARALALFHPERWPEGGVDPRAAVHPEARLGEGARVEPFAVVEADASLGAGCWVQAGAYVGPGARLGERCRLMPGAVVMGGCVLGDRVLLNPGAVVGADGFGFAPTAQGLLKIPQVGPVILGDDVELGANSCVDRPALGETRVGSGTKTDNLCQVGHSSTIGPHSVMVAYSAVAGSSTLGVGVTLAGRASVLGHLEIGDGVVVAAHSMVTRSVSAGERVAGVPARPHREWLRTQALAKRVPELLAELEALRARVEALES